MPFDEEDLLKYQGKPDEGLNSSGFTPFDYRKQAYSNWKTKVDDELLHLHIEMQAVAARLNNLNNLGTAGSGGNKGSGATSKAAAETSEFGKGSDFSSVPDFLAETQSSEEYDKTLGKLTDLEAEGGTSGMDTDDLVHATYAIHEASHAMRGYLMLIDQLGLSKDQRKMIRDLEYAMMMITKLTAAISIISAFMAAPETAGTSLLPLFVAGGMGSASAAYGIKLSGGGA